MSAGEASLSQRLDRLYSGVVYDVMRARGLGDCLLPRTIRPLDVAWRMAGPVFTAEGHPDPEVSRHESLLGWTRLLSAVPSGAVAICQPHDDFMAHMGELSAETLQARGVAGYLVEGGCRDTSFLGRLGFPVFCSYVTPHDIVGRWRVTELGGTIVIGGVSISSGDHVLADCDGTVVVPAALAEEVTSRAEELMNTESAMRGAIRGGMDPEKAYLEFGVF